MAGSSGWWKGRKSVVPSVGKKAVHWAYWKVVSTVRRTVDHKERSMVYQSVDLLVDWWGNSSDNCSVKQLGMREAVRLVVRWVYPSVERKGNRLGHLMAEMLEH